jgi:hypothetical protein
MESIVSQSGVLNLSNTEIRRDGKALLTAEEAATKTEYKFFASANVDCSSKPKVVVVDNSDSYDTASGLVKGKTLSSLVTETILGIATTSINLGNTGFLKTKGEVQDDTLTGGAINQNVYITSTGELSLSPSDKKIGVLLTITSPIKVLVNLAGEASNASSGAAGENFISDYIASAAFIDKFTTYNDGTEHPLDATGGTVTHITFAINNTLPLRSSGDFKFSKSSGNAQGQGVSYDFDYPEYAKNQEVSIEFNYRTTINYVSGDIGIYLYDITNGSLIYPTVIDLPQTTEVSRFRAKFFATSADQYRLVIHVKSTNATAYDIQIDEVIAKRDSAPVGAAISDWNRYSGAFGSTFGSIANNNLFYSRSGENCKIKGSFRMGVDGGGTNVFIPLPPGLNINVYKVVSRVTKLGEATRVSASNVWVSENAYAWDFCYDSALGSNVLRMSGTVISGQYVQNSLGFSNEFFTVDIEVPIAGWSSNINLIQSQTEFAYNTDTSTSVDDTTDFGYGPEGVNFVAATGTGILKKRVRFRNPIQITDKIEVEVNNGNGWQSLPHANTSSSGGTFVDVFRGENLNSADNYLGVGYQVVNQTDIDVVFGKYAASRSYTDVTNWSVVASFKWRVRKSAGSAVGEVAPFVGARYTGHTAAAITANVTSVKFNIKTYDTHNAYNTSTGIYTSAISGYYRVTYSFPVQSICTPRIFKNGIEVSIGNTIPAANYSANYSDEIYLNSGDTIEPRIDSNVTTTTSANSSFSISKIG